MANPIQGGAQVIAHQSSGRKGALALVLAIAGAELLLSGRLGGMWTALWGPVHPLSNPSSGGSGGPSQNPFNPSGGPNGNGVFSPGGGGTTH